MKEKSIDKNNLPKHVAIIMDGNGRWAKQRGLKRIKGHIEGARRVEDLINAAIDIGIEAITLFVFSSENWKRPEKEVFLLMNMIDAVVKRQMGKMMKDNIRFQIIGRKERIPEPVFSTIKKGIDKTSNNTGLKLNLAFNYGARTEIVDAVKEIVSEVNMGKLTIDEISEGIFSKFLYTKDLPDPELMIRTSGEIRISNFLLWQLSYSELYFTDKFWPDFNREEFEKAIINYQDRKRRFGGIANEGEK